MEFKGHREEIVFYDTLGRQKESWVEVRSHPLTGEISRIIHVPLRKLILPDLEKMAEETKENCPFCPSRLAEKTPRFHTSLLKEGVLKRGKGILIPNLFPYDRYCALIILTDAHYVSLGAWEDTDIFDGLMMAREFLSRIIEVDDSVRAFSLNWNFAPHSGSSILHPHIQLSAGAYATNRARRLMAASYTAMLKGKDIMAEWINAEREAGVRWCGSEGPWHITLAFAPRGRFFEINLLHESAGRFPLLGEEDVMALSRGITRSLRFVAAAGFASMNLSLFSPLREAGAFHPMVSVSPRACVGPYHMSDISFQMLIDEFFTLYLPEEEADQFRSAERMFSTSAQRRENVD